VAHSRAGWGGVEGKFSDYFAFDAGDQLVEAFGRVLEAFAPEA